MKIERRRFIRHPLSYPIKTRIVGGTGGELGSPHRPPPGNFACFPVKAAGEGELTSKTEDIGAGGLLFHCKNKIPVGTEVEVEIHVERRVFVLSGRVVRTQEVGECESGIAVAFTSPSDLLKVRMMEQIVRIELFKTRLERRYRMTLDYASVAREWIKRYSKIFADHYAA
jgi:hypothetical protein